MAGDRLWIDPAQGANDIVAPQDERMSSDGYLSNNRLLRHEFSAPVSLSRLRKSTMLFLKRRHPPGLRAGTPRCRVILAGAVPEGLCGRPFQTAHAHRIAGFLPPARASVGIASQTRNLLISRQKAT
jgi:hypothetical protein